MSVRPEQNDTGYCDPEDILPYFRQFNEWPEESEELGPGTTQDPSGIRPPTRSDVQQLILRASARIDRETGHAWRERRVEDEIRDIKGPYYWNSGVPVPLLKRNIVTPIDSSQGDKLEVWQGEEWHDWAADDAYTYGRDGDYWVDEANGILHIYRRPLYINHLNLRVTYRYGSTGGYGVPEDIKEACAKLVAAELYRSDVYGTAIPGSDNDVGPERTAEAYEEQALRILKKRKELRNPL